MDFNFDTGAIFGGLQTLDVTTLPPLGGTAGVLTVIGNGAITVPKGTTAEQPGTPDTGMFRYNTETTLLEYWNGTLWSPLSTSSSTVTSVAAVSNSSSLTVTGSPITSAGTFTFTLDAGLQALGTFNTTGVLVATGTNTWASRTIQGTSGNISVTNGDGIAADPTIDLASVTQANTGNFVKVTLDGFGRVTGNTAVVQSDITSLVDSVYVNVAGDTMTGDLNMGGTNTVTGLAAPVNGSDAVNKDYADALANGLSWKQSVVAATTGPGTLATSFENGDVIDGVTLVTGMRILIKNQTTQSENGIYTVNVSGAPTRSTDMDSTTPINEINGAAVFVEQGTANADTAWVQIDDVQTLGTDPLQFVQFAGAGAYTAGNGLTLTGNQFSLTTPVSPTNGGTGTTSTPTNGQILIGNGVDYTLATLSAGTGISVANGAGSITISNTGVTSLTGTANQVSVSASTGAVTLSVPSTFIAPGSVEVTTSLTVDTLTPNGALYAGTGGLVTSTGALTNGQILIGSTGNPPVAGTVTGGTGITVTNGAGSITIDIDNTEVVTSFSAGTTGLTPNTATTGAVTLAGTLATTNGGTGLTSIGTANQFLAVNTGATGLEYKTVSAGAGISVTPGANVLTIANTGVTGFSLNDNSTTPIYTVTPTTTTTGSVAATITLNTQSANLVFAGPASGGAAQPTFRGLVFNDLSGALQLYTENAVTPTTPIATGINAVAIGSSSQASAEDGFAVGDGTDARIIGMKAYANGQFSTTPGSAQHGVYVVRNTTTTNALTELFINGTSEQIVVPDNALFTFDILVAGRRTDATGGGAGYRFVGVVKKDATAGSVTFVGTPSKTVLGETNAAWDAAVSVDTATGAFRVRVTGENAKTIRWVATVLTTEVTN